MKIEEAVDREKLLDGKKKGKGKDVIVDDMKVCSLEQSPS